MLGKIITRRKSLPSNKRDLIDRGELSNWPASEQTGKSLRNN